MAIIENPYRCDVCGKPKGEANKWLMGIVIDRRGSIPKYVAIEFGLCIPYDTDSSVGYSLVKWDEELAFKFRQYIHHFCGEQCALKKQAEYIR